MNEKLVRKLKALVPLICILWWMPAPATAGSGEYHDWCTWDYHCDTGAGYRCRAGLCRIPCNNVRGVGCPYPDRHGDYYACEGARPEIPEPGECQPVDFPMITNYCEDDTECYWGEVCWDHDCYSPGRSLEAIGFNRHTGYADNIAEATPRPEESNGIRGAGWDLSYHDEVLGHGDLNGDGVAEIIVAGPDDIAVLARDGDELLVEVSYEFGDGIGSGSHSWVFRSTDTVDGVGDLNGDGAEEIVIRGASGIAVLTLTEHRYLGSTLAVIERTPLRSYIGDWRVDGNDTIEALGNFDGSPGMEMILRNDHGLAIVKLEEQRGKYVTFYNFDLIDRCRNCFLGGNIHSGGWTLDADDTVVGVGDFDGDGADSFILQDDRGIGSIGLAGGQLLAEFSYTYGGYIGYWRLSANDSVDGAGELDGLPGDEILLRGPAGLALLTFNGIHRVTCRWIGGRRYCTGPGLTSLDEWYGYEIPGGRYSHIEGVGNFDDQGADEMAVRSGYRVLAMGYRGGRFRQVSSVRVNYGDTVLGTPDMNDDGQADLLIRTAR